MLRSFQQGEEAGFTYIFNKYYPVLSYYAMGFVNNREKAEEIVQSAFVDLWKKREDFTEIKALKFYLYRSVSDKCAPGFDELKKKEGKLNEEEATAITDQAHLEAIIRAEFWNELYRLSKLPPGSKKE